MTPTLVGRWQTRLFLLGTIGLAVTLIFGRFVVNDYITPLAALGYVLVIGFVWDIIYDFVQTYRWDHDWPPLLQWIGAIFEAAFLWGLILVGDQIGIVGPSLPGISANLSLSDFLMHYTSVWILVFLASQSFMRMMYPRWRFDGGKWM